MNIKLSAQIPKSGGPELSLRRNIQLIQKIILAINNLQFCRNRIQKYPAEVAFEEPIVGHDNIASVSFLPDQPAETLFKLQHRIG